MPKKQKSKTRLDKYYYLAKDHGFRSRACFKLIQLNKKYNFFSNATVCIDLCAAPGGWLQAASKFMPMSSIKVGVDLVPIKPIPGCTTIVSDITTQDCRTKLEKELKHMKADIVLNDGAPNVGGNWNFDAYTQSELVLHAVKLASEFLKVGGCLVTKVFRSSDYSSLIYVMNKLFNKVEATKPLASRQVSAEIFVVCQGFKGGEIDSKLLDPKHALKQLEDEEDMKLNSIKSIKALLEATTGRHRSGYYSDSLYKAKEFSEFVETNNPYQFFYEVNKITINSDKSKEYLDIVKKPGDYINLFSDLKVLGKQEFQILINWREKIRVKTKKIKKASLQKESTQNELELNSDNIDSKEAYKQKRMKEIDEEIAKLEKAKKKKQELIEKKREKNELRQKISFIRESENNVDDGTEFDQNLFDYLNKNKINIEELKYKSIEQLEKELKEEAEKLFNENNKEYEADEIDLSEFSEDQYYEMMNKEVEDNIVSFKEQRDDKAAKKLEQKENKKGKKERKIKNLNLDDVSDIEDNNKIVTEKDSIDENNDNSELSSENNECQEEDDENSDYIEDKYGEFDLEQDKLSDTTGLTKETPNDEFNFDNPLKKKKNNNVIKSKINNVNENTIKVNNLTEEDDLSSDSDNDEMNNKLLNKKRRKKSNNEDISNKENNNNNKINNTNNNNNESEYDSDDIAEIRAIAKKMLRKKDRLNIINNSYNRYAYNDYDDVPDWFVEDENKHNKAVLPVTKEEIQAERELLKKINDRMPKKILEAKHRKKKRMARQMEKIKKKAQVISNQEEIGEGSKIRQIEKLYKRELNKNKESKKYVFVRSNQKVGKDSRNVKYVDKRLKKDKRSQKRAERKNKNLKKIKAKTFIKRNRSNANKNKVKKR